MCKMCVMYVQVCVNTYVDEYIFMSMLLCTCIMCEYICLSVCVCMYLYARACFYMVFEHLPAHVCGVCVHIQKLCCVEIYLRGLDLPRLLLLPI